MSLNKLVSALLLFLGAFFLARSTVHAQLVTIDKEGILIINVLSAEDSIELMALWLVVVVQIKKKLLCNKKNYKND